MSKAFFISAAALILVACGASFVGPATKPDGPQTVDCHDGTTCDLGTVCTSFPGDPKGPRCETPDEIPTHW